MYIYVLQQTAHWTTPYTKKRRNAGKSSISFQQSLVYNVDDRFALFAWVFHRITHHPPPPYHPNPIQSHPYTLLGIYIYIYIFMVVLKHLRSVGNTGKRTRGFCKYMPVEAILLSKCMMMGTLLCKANSCNPNTRNHLKKKTFLVVLGCNCETISLPGASLVFGQAPGSAR